MKKLLAALTALLVLPVLFAGCSRVDPGPMTTRNFDFSGFSTLEINSMFEVEVIQSSVWSVGVTAQETLFDQIKVTQSGDTLEINLQWNWGTWVSSWGYQRPKARITMPELSILRLSGASRGSVKGFKSSTLDTDMFISGASSIDVDYQARNTRIEVSGASHVTGKVKTGVLRLNIDGASNGDLIGSADSIELEASGASRAGLEDLVAGTIQIELSGASKAVVSPRDKMSVDISGASSLTYTGNPSLESIEVSGASTVHKK